MLKKNLMKGLVLSKSKTREDFENGSYFVEKRLIRLSIPVYKLLIAFQPVSQLHTF